MSKHGKQTQPKAAKMAIPKRRKPPVQEPAEEDSVTVFDFSVVVDGENISVGEMRGLTSGDMDRMIPALANYVVVDGYYVDAKLGEEKLNAIKVSELEAFVKNVQQEIVGDSDPN